MTYQWGNDTHARHFQSLQNFRLAIEPCVSSPEPSANLQIVFALKQWIDQYHPLWIRLPFPTVRTALSFRYSGKLLMKMKDPCLASPPPSPLKKRCCASLLFRQEVTLSFLSIKSAKYWMQAGCFTLGYKVCKNMLNVGWTSDFVTLGYNGHKMPNAG